MLKSMAQRSVLIVDDDAFFHTHLSLLLGDHGLKDIRVALNGASALKMMDTPEWSPDLLICDVYMPDMDGMEFLTLLSGRNYRGSIVLVSGEDIAMLDLALVLGRGLGLNVTEAYAKPITPDQLAHVVQSTISNSA